MWLRNGKHVIVLRLHDSDVVVLGVLDAVLEHVALHSFPSGRDSIRYGCQALGYIMFITPDPIPIYVVPVGLLIQYGIA